MEGVFIVSTVGDRIKKRRKLLGLTIEDLAAALGKDKATIRFYENADIQEFPDAELESLATVLGVFPAWLMGYDNSVAFRNRQKKVEIPILSSVCASPDEVDDHIIGYEKIPESLARLGKFFGFIVHDSSMEPEMREGDIVICKWEQNCDSDDTVIITVNGDDAIVRKIEKSADGMTLISHNASVCPPKFYSNGEIETLSVRIVGIVYELIRKFG